jgi:hypothetical protein
MLQKEKIIAKNTTRMIFGIVSNDHYITISIRKSGQSESKCTYEKEDLTSDTTNLALIAHTL